MTIQLQLVPLISIIAGVVILIAPKLLNYTVAAYLILSGLVAMTAL